MESFTISFQLATDFINATNRAVFLTGKAGTGKTTFLRQIKQHSHKQTAVVAPTGVAAINAGGSTIHSFFQLPFYPYLPEAPANKMSDAIYGKGQLIGRIKLTTRRRKVLQELELLIIDEISMVRCDILDAIDVILKHVRHRSNEPFGGVQILLIGDMFQLSPVAGNREWNELRQYYNSPYFFHSRVMMQMPPIYIELDRIYRQKNAAFIKVLNEVRNNNLTSEGYRLLLERYNPSFVPEADENYITLSTHNSSADRINALELSNLQGKVVRLNAIITGEYPENSFPIDKELQLKIGAKVMFVKNDLEKDKRFYNGKIGVVTAIDEEKIAVQCSNEPEPIMVSPYTWENVKTDVDPATHQLDEKVIGTFQQFPLRLAWAITIHKSQGLTFERAIIDAGQAFATGQVYVALSRCTSLEGIILKSPINSSSLSNDQHIVHYSSTRPAVDEIQKFLLKEKVEFQKQLLIQLFDFGVCQNYINSLSTFLRENIGSFNQETEVFIQDLQRQCSKLQVIATKFQSQLQSLSAVIENASDELQNRISAASVYFSSRIDELISLINHSVVETDSKVRAQTFNDMLSDLFIALAQKQHLMIGIKSKYSVEQYYRSRRSFMVPPFKVNAYSARKKESVSYPLNADRELFRELRALRNELCEQKDVPVYMVASSATLEELTNYRPLTPDDLSKISGFGKAKIEAYGQRFLDVIVDYCARNKLGTLIHTKTSRIKKERNKKAKVDTKLVSFQYYKSGKTVQEIAELRNFTVGTIQGHLAHYVVSGDLSINELISEDRVRYIEAALRASPDADLSSLKQQLGDDVSYGEIRLVSDFYLSKHAIEA